MGGLEGLAPQPSRPMSVQRYHVALCRFEGLDGELREA
jgi:hypothetical protein